MRTVFLSALYFALTIVSLPVDNNSIYAGDDSSISGATGEQEASSNFDPETYYASDPSTVEEYGSISEAATNLNTTSLDNPITITPLPNGTDVAIETNYTLPTSSNIPATSADIDNLVNTETSTNIDTSADIIDTSASIGATTNIETDKEVEFAAPEMPSFSDAPVISPPDISITAPVIPGMPTINTDSSTPITATTSLNAPTSNQLNAATTNQLNDCLQQQALGELLTSQCASLINMNGQRANSVTWDSGSCIQHANIIALAVALTALHLL